MLDGIKIIDLTTLLPGPHVTSRLLELGATVIKAEPPGGDLARYSGPKTHDGVGLVFEFYRSGKVLDSLDLKNDAHRTRFFSWIKEADVLIQGFRPGVATRLGIDYPALHPLNPRLIYCALTGYGQTGPLAEAAGHDINYQALSGLLSQCLDVKGTPFLPTIPWADLFGAHAAVEAILAALVERANTGLGQFLDIAMTGTLRQLLRLHDAIDITTGFTRGIEELTGQSVCYHLYQTGDQRWMALGALEPKFWTTFCHGIDHPEWISQQWSSAVRGNPVFDDLVTIFQAQRQTVWTTWGQAWDCCLTPVLSLEEARDIFSLRLPSTTELLHRTNERSVPDS